MNRYERWSAEFKAALAETGMTAAEFARRYRALDAESEDFTDATASKWGNPAHRSAPSPKAALRAAIVLNKPAPYMLRAAGHGDLVDLIEEYVSTLGESQPAGNALRRLYDADLDAKTTRRLAEEHQQAYASADRKLDLEIADALSVPRGIDEAGARAHLAGSKAQLADAKANALAELKRGRKIVAERDAQNDNSSNGNATAS